jgi:hypothetical protein
MHGQRSSKFIFLVVLASKQFLPCQDSRGMIIDMKPETSYNPLICRAKYFSHCICASYLRNSNHNPMSEIRIVDKDETPLSLATPVPSLPISSMVTMYSSTLTGVLGAFDPPKRLPLFSSFS